MSGLFCLMEAMKVSKPSENGDLVFMAFFVVYPIKEKAPDVYERGAS